MWDLFEEGASSTGDEAQQAQLQAQQAQRAQQEDRADSSFSEVPRELLEELEYYRPFACLLYYITQDDQLSAALAERGGLACPACTWSSSKRPSWPCSPWQTHAQCCNELAVSMASRWPRHACRQGRLSSRLTLCCWSICCRLCTVLQLL